MYRVGGFGGAVPGDGNGAGEAFRLCGSALRQYQHRVAAFEQGGVNGEGTHGRTVFSGLHGDRHIGQTSPPRDLFVLAPGQFRPLGIVAGIAGFIEFGFEGQSLCGGGLL